MTEGLAETRTRDDLSRDAVNLFTSATGPNGVNRRHLRLQYYSIYLPQFGRNFTGHDDTRQVVHIESGVDTPIDQREIALAESTIRWRRVRQRRAIADGDDRRKAERLGAKPSSLVLQLRGH